MFMVDVDWTHIVIWAFVFAFLILLKYLVTYFFLLRDTNTVVLGQPRHCVSVTTSRRPTIVWDVRTRYVNQIRPPPEFSVAIQNSLPISYIEIEEPPPTYEECIKKWPDEKHLETELKPPSTEKESKLKTPVVIIV